MSEDIKILGPDGNPINPDPAPLRPDGTPMQRFEVRMRRHPGGEIEKAIFIGGEKLDWSIDVSSFFEASKMGPQFKRAVQEDIAKHFIKSVGEFIGRHITIEEIKAAIKFGWI